MSSSLGTTLGDDFAARLPSFRVLVVGAGGIGCELLKNLVVAGFRNIEVIDLDHIDISNLNRQFLFHQEDVGRPKSLVAVERIMEMMPPGRHSLTAHVGSIISTKYSYSFFRKFDIVLNALDNVEARAYVNSMCVALDVPLVESGTQGYDGQVYAIHSSIGSMVNGSGSECYACYPKPTPKTFPYCVLKGNPSQIAHCVQWSVSILAHLFCSEDKQDSEEARGGSDGGDAIFSSAIPQDRGEGGNGLEGESEESGTFTTFRPTLMKYFQPIKSDWADSSIGDDDDDSFFKNTEWKTDPRVQLGCDVFARIFGIEIREQQKLNEESGVERPPLKPLDVEQSVASENPAVAENTRMFLRATWEVLKLWHRGYRDGGIQFDKDVACLMDWVAAASNLRAYNFRIPTDSAFNIKGIAGRIVPAIATTNAIIASLIVLEAWKILRGRSSDCRYVICSRGPNRWKRKSVLLLPSRGRPRNPCCPVCAQPYWFLSINAKETSFGDFVDKVLKETLGFKCVSVSYDSGKLVYDEEDEDEDADEDAEDGGESHLSRTRRRSMYDVFGQNEKVLMNVEDYDAEMTGHVIVVRDDDAASDFQSMEGNVSIFRERAHTAFQNQRKAEKKRADEEAQIAKEEASMGAVDMDMNIAVVGEKHSRDEESIDVMDKESQPQLKRMK